MSYLIVAYPPELTRVQESKQSNLDRCGHITHFASVAEAYLAYLRGDKIEFTLPSACNM